MNSVGWQDNGSVYIDRIQSFHYHSKSATRIACTYHQHPLERTCPVYLHRISSSVQSQDRSNGRSHTAGKRSRPVHLDPDCRYLQGIVFRPVCQLHSSDPLGISGNVLRRDLVGTCPLRRIGSSHSRCLADRCPDRTASRSYCRYRGIRYQGGMPCTPPTRPRR